MPDTVIINIITPPAEPVEVDVIEEGGIDVEVSSVGETGPQGPPGPSGLGNEILLSEPVVGAVNGSNATFTTSENFSDVSVYINGLLQKIVDHYQTVGTDTIIFNESPESGDIILTDLIKL